MSDDMTQARASLAPSGPLRVGINLSNFLLTRRGASATSEPDGIAPDIARDLATRLGVAVQFVQYASPGALADAASADAWDVAFLASETARATTIDFTAAYLEIEASYLLPAGSPIRDLADVDQPGVRISVVERSAYDLWLRRHILKATLVSAANLDESYRIFVEQRLEVLSGLRPRLVLDAAQLPGARILDGRFMAVQQAIAAPKGRDNGIDFLRAYCEDIKRTGLVAQLIARNEVHGVCAAPLLA